MPDKPIDKNHLYFLRVSVRRAEVSKASNHRDGHDLCMCAGWEVVSCRGTPRLVVFFEKAWI